MPRKKSGAAKRQFNVRLDLETHRLLKRLARETKKTRTDLITGLIQNASWLRVCTPNTPGPQE